DAPVAKKAKVTGEKTVKAAPKKKATPTPKVKIGVQINFAPTQVLDVYVFGEGSAGELGLGATKVDGKKPIDVKRPRKNVNLSAELVGVVQVACGGMHAIALTKDNKILTWGVNDQGTLGRDTQWDGGLRNVDVAEEDSDSDSDDSGLNPRESTPTEVNTKNIAPGTKFVQVAATDSASFALTEDGRVYSWGTFRCSDGILGFSKDTKIQWYPALLPEPTKVVAIATGSNHVMTLDNKGKIQTWGAAEQNQLGRRVVERDMKASALRPAGLNFKRGVKITKIACGSYHSFAIDGEGRVWAWGLNNFSQLGVEADAGEDDATLLQPTLVEALAGHVVTGIVGGEHHSVAVTEDGKALAFGRIDGSQVGVPRDAFSQENCVYDGCGQPRILVVPAVLDIPGAVVCADAGTDTSLVVTREGKAYSWGFNSNYQCGVGETAGDVLVPTLINNSAVRDSSVVWAGAGGQFSMLASVHEDA
ncbi:RCC1/BLIP-II, partial [Cryphonectria parasitica EP155]